MVSPVRQVSFNSGDSWRESPPAAGLGSANPPVGQPVDNGPVSTTAQPNPDEQFHLCVVCSGNICRSPIGEQVLRAAIAEAGLADRVVVSSAGTGGWHLGQGANPRSERVLRAAGYPEWQHTARMISRADLRDIDLVLAADRGHLADLRAMTDEPAKVVLLRSFDPDADDDEVPDPYYGPDSGFDEVLAMTRAAAPGVVEEVRRLLSAAPASSGR
jgi:protein-tyrosine phosphatase